MITSKFAFFFLLGLAQASFSWAQQPPLPEVLDVKNVLFDGILPRFFSVQEFENHFHELDSTVLLIDMQPCSYVFEYEDGSKDADDEYWYKDGSRFERSKEKLAVDTYRFTKDHFILFEGIRLDASTTIAELAQHFPIAANAVRKLEVEGEGQLQVITFREDAENLSDGQIHLFLKDGKLYFIHWWFPC